MTPSELPISDEEWMALVQSVAAWGDRAESRAIELKGRDLIPSSKEGAAKVARFVLGAANRVAPDADEELDGHAVMLIGIESDGTLSGALPVETHEVSRLVSKYVGDGPRWSLKWIAAAEGIDVLAVVVRPAKAGDPPFVARADGVNIASGDLYVRRNGETSKALAAEHDALMARAAGAAPALPQLTVEFSATVNAFALSQEDFMLPISGRALELEEALDRATRTDTARKEAQLRATAALGVGSFLAQRQFDPEDRTEDEYRQQIAKWEEECAGLYEDTVEGLIPYAGRPGFFRLTNTSTQYLTNVQVSIHVPGNVFGYEPDGAQVRRSDFLPSPPRKWGPVERPNWAAIAASSRLSAHQFAPLYPPPMPAIGPHARLDNSGSIDVTLTVPELRPSATVEFNDDEWVLAWKGPDLPPTIACTWTATARGLDAVLNGGFEIQCGQETDMADFWTGRAYAPRGEASSGGEF